MSLQQTVSKKEQDTHQLSFFRGGDPCQPHSFAGKRLGMEDERYLWPEMFRVIKEIKPDWIINENVAGSLSNGIVDKKIDDLEGQGYDAQAFSIPAYSVGAWHIRQRIFIVANSCKDRSQRWTQSLIINERPKEQFTGLCKMDSLYSVGESKQKTYKTFKPIGDRWESWKEFAREFGGEIPSTYWALSEPPIPGVDDGVSNRVDRSITLGNAVVPQQVYPIVKAIADIERLRK